MDYVKNQILTVTIEDLGDNGEGIGKIDGYTLFVKDALIGDKVKARLTKVKKNYSYGRVEAIVEPSPFRTEPKCKEHRRCGGCQLQALTLEQQLKFKENKVKNNLVRIGGFDREFIDKMYEGIIGMKEPFFYRNKSQYPIGEDKCFNPVAGFYAGRTHDIIPCTNCCLAPKENQEILDAVLSHMKRFKVHAYNEESGCGTIRHVLIRKGFSTGEIMVCLVIKHIHTTKGGCKNSSEYIAHQDEFIEELSKIKGVASICVSVNNLNTNVIMGNEIHTLWGKDKIEDILLGKKFEISPLSFYQVNPIQVEKLYSAAIDFAELSGDEEVWDICCGIGTISLCMADSAGYVHGLEIVPEAIEDAKKNALLNDVKNADFICAAAEDYLPKHKDEIKADVVVFDPPRKGMDEKALKAVVSVSPSKIVYVSCDSATLARDLKYLCENGYEIRRLKCVDMFPQTVHVETCVALVRTGL